MSVILRPPPPSGAAVKDSYKLDKLISSAVAECPSAYEIISDPNTYRFETNMVESEDGTYAFGEVVHIGYWNHKRHNIPVWAGLQNEKVSYYYGGAETGVKPMYEPFFHEHKSKILEHVIPFRFVTTNNWPGDYDTGIKIRAAARPRIALLVKFAFLLTNRIDQIKDTADSNLPVNLRNMCVVMKNIKDIGEGESANRSEDEENNGSDDSMKVETSRETTKSASGVVDSTPSTVRSPVKNAKRAAVTSVPDDEYVEPNVEPNLERGT